MYRNFNAECARAGISKSDIAQNVLGISPSTLSWKEKAPGRFRIDECIEIKKFLKTDLPLEFLFEFDNSQELSDVETA